MTDSGTFRVASTDGVTVTVHDLGGPDGPDAPVLLFSHATGFHGMVFEPMAVHLRQRYRCLSIDYRGHGLTRLPEGVLPVWSGMGDDCLAVLESEVIGPDRRVHGVGHSMGGAALVLAEARRPGSFRSLWLYEPVLVPPGLLPTDSGGNHMSAAAGRRRATFSSYEEAIANYASKPPLNQLHPDTLRAYVHGGFDAQADGRVRLRCRPGTEAVVYQGAGESGAWEVLPSLHVPVAMVTGREEGFGPVTFAPLATAAMPDSTRVLRPQFGHFGPLESPESMAHDLTDWVESHP